MTHITPALIRTIRDESIEALQEVAKKHGLTVQASSKTANYSPSNVDLPFLFAKTDEDGEVITKEMEALKMRYPDHAGKKFYVPGEGYVKLTGYRVRAPKRPLMIEKNGQTYVTGISYIDRLDLDRVVNH
tara:strand:+ start:962 stop:1351 length:390 start_codon:yes stop_codon:yes gene_type:complete